MHLISVFDLLIAAGCDVHISTAGALHSIYGTSFFNKITISPSIDNRQAIRLRFGTRVERLCYLFHACKRKCPNNIETGILFDRSSCCPLPDVIFSDVQALRLIEAANVIDERNEDVLKTKLPKVFATWKFQQLTRNQRTASQVLSPKPHSHLLGLKCFSTSYNNEVGVRLRVYPSTDNSSSIGYDVWLPLSHSADYDDLYTRLSYILEVANSTKNSEINKPMGNCLPSNNNCDNGTKEKHNRDNIINDDKDIKEWDDNANRIDNEMGVSSPHNDFKKWMVVFTLKGESKMGMPWTPLWFLCRYIRCICGHRQGKKSQFLEIDVKYLKPYDLNEKSHMYSYLTGISRSVNQCRQGPPSIPLNSVKSNANINGTVYSNIHTVIDSMRTYGYAVISVDDSAAKKISEAYEALLRFHAIPVEEKKKSFKKFDGDRYIGWTKDRAREWIQMRTEYPDNDGLLWPAGCTADDRESMVAAVKFLTLAAEEIFEEIGVSIGIGSRNYLRSIFRPGPQGLQGDLIKEEQGIHLNGTSPSSSKQTGTLSTEEEGVNMNRSSSLGSSVCRLFVYLDREEIKNISKNVSQTPPLKQVFIPAAVSGAHADMGLLTLSPASTIPSLNLIHPDTHHVVYPEQGLAANECILFAGETLSYLTAGVIQAPIHSVPYINRKIETNEDINNGSIGSSICPLRRSMPLFLRALPDAYLHPLSESYMNSTSGVLPQISPNNECVISNPSNDNCLSADLSINESVTPNLSNNEHLPVDPHGINITDTIKTKLDIIPLSSLAGKSTYYNEDNRTSMVDRSKNQQKGDISDGLLESSNDALLDNDKEPFVISSPTDLPTLSPYALTCREFTLNHSIGLRPWRLNGGTHDF